MKAHNPAAPPRLGLPAPPAGPSPHPAPGAVGPPAGAHVATVAPDLLRKGSYLLPTTQPAGRRSLESSRGGHLFK